MKSLRVALGLSILTSALIVAALRPQVEAHALSSVIADGSLAPEIVRQLGLSGPGAVPIPPTPHTRGSIEPLSGLPELLNPAAPLSAALMTTVGGQNTTFSDVGLIADWDGREDSTADRSATVDDFSLLEPEPDMTLTRVAISEHTRANGFDENVYYYGDSIGNVWVGVDSTGDAFVDSVLQINLPTTLNAFGTLLSDDQITITGLGVNPVADLSSFANVNGAFAGFDGLVGEILYVSYMDSGAGLRLSVNNTVVRSGVIAFPIADVISPAALPPGTISDTGFPVTVGGAFGVAFSVFHNFAGLAVDDDGSVYFQQVDLQQLTGANIVKITDVGDDQDRSLATNGFITLTSLNPAGGQYGATSGPVTQRNLFTNYSGTSTTFGNIVSLATGPCNVLYAALAKSNTAPGNPFEGVFPAPAAFPAGTPSMVISFSDTTGGFDVCSSIPGGLAGEIPVANGIADVAATGLVLAPGVNNFRVFVHGNGPDLRSVLPIDNKVTGNTENTLKLDMQIDFTIHSGLAISEASKLFVIAGGTPAGVGLNPSARRTEILAFEDHCPEDRRGDFVDYRGDNLPNPPASGGNVGDGDSDRFDHIFSQAPVDGVSLMPTGLSGLARGFLRYTNRLAPNEISPGVTLGQTGGAGTQGDDDTAGPIVFEALDPSHQVAGGDDQNVPFRGDDADGLGTSPLVATLEGGFEFAFGGPVGTAACVWNEFFLNSNGNITFGAGDTDNTADIQEFRSGDPRIAPAWNDLNPAARAVDVRNFPVQAIGFADVNEFKVRWINVPEFGGEGCGSRNTLSLSLEDDGTGTDENASQPLNPANPIGNNAVPFDLQEGPSDLHFEVEPLTEVNVGCPPRRSGAGWFCFEYCRMDLLGVAGNPVLVGYSIGALDPLNPPGLCEIDVGEAARASDAGIFGVIQGTTASIEHCYIGEGTEPTLYEFFDDGSAASIGPGGTQIFAVADFDLRDEGNDPALRTPTHQSDPNRDRVCFFGVSCTPPANPTCQAVLPAAPVSVGPNQPPVGPGVTGLINALCEVQLNIAGCGFFPNEITRICPGVPPDGGVPVDRPGKIVSTAITLTCDTNGDGIPESTTSLSNVTPVSENLITATLSPLTSLGFPGTPFPLACCGGNGFLTITTTFTAGDNNVFGPFTRTTTCPIDLGVRAPVVLSVTGVSGDCSLPQDLLISGACFVLPEGNVSRVFAVEFNPTTQTLNPANTIDAAPFTVLNTNLIDAFFNFGAANAGKTFMIFATGPGGTSRNLTAGQTPPGCVSGNQQGIQVTFNCQGQSTSGKVVTIVANDAAASEPGTNKGSFRVGRTGSLVAPLVVKYSIGGTASMGSDFSNLSGTVTIPAGAATASFLVVPQNDSAVECPETVIATVILNGGAYSIGSPSSATVTISDNDLPVLTITAPDPTASEPGSNTATFRVSRTGCTDLPLTFNATVGGTATPGSDYTATGGGATIPAGQSSITYTVTAVNNNTPEPPETIIMTLTAKSTYVLGVPKTATVTINDND